MFRSNISGESTGNFEEMRFLRVRTIECEDILQKLQNDPNAGRVRFASNVTAEKNLAVEENFTVNGDIAAATLTLTSDARLKEKITPLLVDEAINIVKGIGTYKFNFKSSPDKTHVGVMSHEVNKVLPCCVKKNKFDSVNYAGLNSVLFGVVKNLLSRVEHLEKKITLLSTKEW